MVDIHPSIYCKECGNKLEAEVFITLVIRVEPCKTCIKKALEGKGVIKHIKQGDKAYLQSIAVGLEKASKSVANKPITEDMKWLCNKLREVYTYMENY